MPGGSETLEEHAGRESGRTEFLKPQLREAGDEWGPMRWRTEEHRNLQWRPADKEHLSLEELPACFSKD